MLCFLGYSIEKKSGLGFEIGLALFNQPNFLVPYLKIVIMHNITTYESEP